MSLKAARAAMEALADSLPPAELGRHVYVAFRLSVPAGARGWDAWARTRTRFYPHLGSNLEPAAPPAH
jgi:hypothetical protein